MTNSEAVLVAVQLDIKGLDAGVAVLRGLSAVAGKVAADISGMFAGAVKGVKSLETSIRGLSTSITNAITAVNKLMETLEEQGNVDLTFNIISTALSSISTACDLFGKDKGYGVFTNWRSAAEKLMAIFPKLSSAFSSAGTAISKGFGKISSVFNGATLGWAAVIAAVVAGVILIIQNWDSIKQALGTAAAWLNTTVIQPVVGFFTGLWTSIVNIVTQIWNGIVTVCSGIAQWVNDNVIVPVMNIFTPIVEWFAALFGSIWQTISDVFYNIGVIITGCWQIIQAVWQLAAEWFSTNVIQPLTTFFSDLWTGITTLASDAWAGIQSIIGGFCTWIDTNVVRPVSKFFSDMWAGFSAAASNAWEAVKSVFGAVARFFKDIFSDAWEGVVKVFSVAGDIFVNIKDGILTAFKTIVNGIITGINAVVKVPFDGINSALSVVRNVTILDFKPFSGLKSISVPQIPKLAQGAVLPANRPFLAVVGDQKHGTNVEAPLATIQDALTNVLARQGTGDINITFTGDLAQLARVLKPVIDKEGRRVGGSLAKGAI